MITQFEKFHGTGNDFIVIDNRQLLFHANQKTIYRLCHRRFGIGADGLILIQLHPDFDFEMIYFNADGGEGSMCGNGGRCAVIFSRQLGMIDDSVTFLACDGIHSAEIKNDDIVKLSMSPVSKIEKVSDAFVLDTGSPHYVAFVDNLTLDVIAEGKKIRNSDAFKEKGINVNFVQIKGKELLMRTYERGVEDETLACGTGTVATAIAASLKLNKEERIQTWTLHALGGDLKVYFKRESADHFTNIWLEGSVTHVFSGEIEI